MALEKFSLGAIETMDNGRIGLTFAAALNRCLADCKDRPALKEPRRLTLSVTVTPVHSAEGELDSCDVQMQVLDSLPRRRSKTYNMQASRAGLLFNDLSPEDVHQRTLDEAVGPRREADAS